MNNNIIFTGIPRSGTTLSCHLMNRLDNTVALHEPMKTLRLLKYKRLGITSYAIDLYFKNMRKRILKHGTAISKQVNGVIPDNPVISNKNESGLRIQVVQRAPIKINKTFTNNGVLIIKHPSAFTAILKDLIKRFNVFATIRNPIAVLGSWNSVPMPVRKGNAPAAERLNRELKKSLKNVNDLIERQLIILSWFYKQYYDHLSPQAIIRYEDLIESNGKILKIITPQAEQLSAKLTNKNSNTLYKASDIETIGKRLLESDGYYWEFYHKNSVEELLKALK